MKWVPEHSRPWVAISIGAILLLLFFSGLTDFLFPQPLKNLASSELDSSLATHTGVLASLSVMKAILGVVEGSTLGASLGASLQVELGDIVEPAYDFLDLIWHLFVSALFVLGLYKIVLESGVLALGILLSGATLLYWGFARFAGSDPHLSRLFFLGLFLFYGIPFTLLGASQISSIYLAPLREKREVEISQMRDRMVKLRGTLGELRQSVSILAPQRSMDAVQTKFEDISDELTSLTWNGLGSVSGYLLVLLCEILVLPLMVAFVLSSLLGRSVPATTRLANNSAGKK